MSTLPEPSPGNEPARPGLLRGIHPLVATAAIAVTAVCAIAAYQFLVPRDAESAIERDAHGGTAKSTHAAAGSGRSAGEPSEPARSASAPPPCTECGEVVGIRTTRQEGEGSGLGAVAGGVLGGVLGHQVGAGRGKDAMTIVGAVGGAFAGNQVEKQAKAQTVYLVDVRMADGTIRTFPQAAPPSLAVGAPVRVAGNTISAR